MSSDDTQTMIPASQPNAVSKWLDEHHEIRYNPTEYLDSDFVKWGKTELLCDRAVIPYLGHRRWSCKHGVINLYCHPKEHQPMGWLLSNDEMAIRDKAKRARI